MTAAFLPDSSGEAWMLGRLNSKAALERKVIGTIIVADDDRELHVPGCVFVVYASGSTAICVCAAHSIDYLRDIDRSQQRVLRHLPPNDGELPDPEYLDPERFRVLFLSEDGKTIVQCHIRDLQFQANNDLAVIAIEAVDGRSFFDWHASLSFDVPAIGDVVMTIGQHIDLNRESGVLAQTLELRRGVVTDITFGKSGAGQSFVFHATFPTPGGMSGSPVFVDAKKGEPLVAVGVVSADMSPPESHQDRRIAGRSTISMLWPIGGFGLSATWPNGEARVTTLFDLVECGIIPNASKRSTFRSTVSRDRTRIEYRDSAHGGYILEAPGHPLASC